MGLHDLENLVDRGAAFTIVARLAGHRRKPERAWREFAERGAVEMPGQLVRVA